MSWQGIEGHDEVIAQLRRALERGRLASTFLFVGPAGVGKRVVARKLAQVLLCQTQPLAELDPCGHCTGCIQVLAGTHPDLHWISRPKDRAVIPVDLLIGSDQKRMQEGLCHDISLKPFMGGRRVAVIDDADSLAAEGANCLLKTLEEPPPHSVLILIGTSAEKQLPTIRSRCQIIRFGALPEEVVARVLLEQGSAANETEAARLALHSEGSIERATELADPELWAFRGELLRFLSRSHLESVAFAPTLLAFVDAAGKEAARRRDRARLAIGFAANFYRHLLRNLAGASPTDDAELAAAVTQAARVWPGDEETAVACLERCLDAQDHIERNANQATALEAWLDALSRIVQPLTSAHA